MTPNEYQKLAERTECDQLKSRLRMFGVPKVGKPLMTPKQNIRLNHSVLGMAGEVGELAAVVERHVYYGQELDRDGAVEELGDALWYLAEACNALGVSLEDVMRANIRKLQARYPEKYTDYHAAEENRDRSAERNAVVEPVYGGIVICPTCLTRHKGNVCPTCNRDNTDAPVPVEQNGQGWAEPPETSDE